MHSFKTFLRSERIRWQIKDLPWDSLNKSKANDSLLEFCRGAVMGECHSVPALHGFLNEPDGDYDFAAFASLWAFEELQHHTVFRVWLEKIGHPADDLPIHSTKDSFPLGKSFAATMATNIISETMVSVVYRECSKLVDEPVLKLILKNLSADEARHASDFFYFAKKSLKLKPEQLLSVLEVFYTYFPSQNRPLLHPVTLFKGDESEIQDSETIDHALKYFQINCEAAIIELQKKLLKIFSVLTGMSLNSRRDIRLAIVRNCN